MSELDRLRERSRTQEITILKQNAEIARLQKQVGDLVRMHETNQRHIGRLQRQIDRTPRSAAEAAFKGAGE